MKTKLLFDHVPKTAGTSISQALSRMFGEPGTLPDFFNLHYNTVAAAGSRRLLAGHLYFGSSEPVFPDWYYCTIVRDPVDRFLSQYWFYRQVGRQYALDNNNAMHTDPQVRAATENELEQYLELQDPTIRLSFTNIQASHYARRLCNYPDVLSEKALLEAAISSLEEYDLIGTFEDLQGFLDVIAQDMGLTPVRIPRVNVTFERGKLHDTPAHLLDRMRANNAVDQQLHAWAKKRFAARREALQSTANDAAAAPVSDIAPPPPPAAPQSTSALQSITSQPSPPPPSTTPGTLSFGTREAEILTIECVGERSNTPVVQTGEALKVILECRAKTALPDVTVGVAVRDENGKLVFGTNTHQLGLNMSFSSGGTFRRVLALQPNLGPGKYFVTVALHKGASHLEGCYHWIENAVTFTIPGTPTAVDDARALYRALLGRDIDPGALEAVRAMGSSFDALKLALPLLTSGEFLGMLSERAIDAHLYLIHRARQIMVQRLLPAGDRVIDLGGANAPLFTFGWKHKFTNMVMVDLPPDARHEMYRDIVVESPPDCGEVLIHYGDMTRLERYADGSFDLVWSGQSIEHVDLESGARMVREALRVLRPGGHFCLDTPNRGVTEIHTRSIGGGFIHPEHQHEYRAGELRRLLEDAGFEIVDAKGVCEMPKTRATGEFDYQDFVLGNPVTNDPEEGYILYFGCRKPAPPPAFAA